MKSKPRIRFPFHTTRRIVRLLVALTVAAFSTVVWEWRHIPELDARLAMVAIGAPPLIWALLVAWSSFRGGIFVDREGLELRGLRVRCIRWTEIITVSFVNLDRCGPGASAPGSVLVSLFRLPERLSSRVNFVMIFTLRDGSTVTVETGPYANGARLLRLIADRLHAARPIATTRQRRPFSHRRFGPTIPISTGEFQVADSPKRAA